MKVTLLRKSFGAYPGKVGDTLDLPDATAKRLISSGHASPVKTEPLQTTSLPQSNETATKA